MYSPLILNQAAQMNSAMPVPIYQLNSGKGRLNFSYAFPSALGQEYLCISAIQSALLLTSVRKDASFF